MSLQTLFDLFQTTYCERSGPDPFAEPLNALSNLAFVIAAILAARHIQRFPNSTLRVRLLPWSLAWVAIGSALYHTYRSPLSFILDIVFLSAFILGALYLSLHLVLSYPFAAFVGTATFLGLQISLLLLVFSDFLNNSAPYLITLGFSFPVMVVSALRYPVLWKQVVLTAFFYSSAIFFRSIDRFLCPWLPFGTHFLWHLASATASYYVVHFIASLEDVRRGFPSNLNEAINAA